jgi:GAF domain-containing protein
VNALLRIFNIGAWNLRTKLGFGLLTAALIELALFGVGLALISNNLPPAIRDSAGDQIVTALLVVLLPGLVLLGLSWALLSVYVLLPFARLSAGLKQLAQGGYDRPLAVPAISDEIGQATEQLNAINSHFQQTMHEIETSIAHRTRDLEAAREIGVALSAIRDSRALAERVSALLVEHFADVSYAQVFLLNDSATQAVLQAGSGEQGRHLVKQDYQVSVEDPGPVGQVLRRGEPVISTDTKPHAVTDTESMWSDMRAECVLPLRIDSAVLGALDIHSRNANAFSALEMRLFQTIADQLSSLIQNARLFENLQRHISELDALNRQSIAKAWRDYVTGLATDISLLAADEEALSPLQRQALETGTFAEQRTGERVRFAIPIRVRGQPLGAVEWEVPRIAYNESLRALAEELTARLALAADNIRLLEQSQRQAQRERMLNELGSALTQQTDVAEILETAVHQLGQALNVSQTVIELRREISG